MAIAIPAGTTSLILPVGPLIDPTTGRGKTGLAFGDVSAYFEIDDEPPALVTLKAGTLNDPYDEGKWAEVDPNNEPLKGVYHLHTPNTMWPTDAMHGRLYIGGASILPYKFTYSLNSASLEEFLERLLRNTADPLANELGTGKIAATIAAGDAPGLDVYTAEIDFYRSGLADEYTVQFHKSGSSDAITTIADPTISVYGRAAGALLIDAEDLTQVGATRWYKYDEGDARLAAGDIGLIEVGATIDGTAMTFSTICGRNA